jgi:hypothetical protein
MRQLESERRQRQIVLGAGDAIAMLGFVIAGFASHSMYNNWLFNLVRVGAPFLIGWFAVEPLTGAYRLPEPGRRADFMRRSALNWLLGVAVGLFLRATVFRDSFVPTFALVTLGVTGVFMLGWRAIFLWLGGHYAQEISPAPSGGESRPIPIKTSRTRSATAGGAQTSALPKEPIERP